MTTDSEKINYGQCKHGNSLVNCFICQQERRQREDNKKKNDSTIKKLLDHARSLKW